ncbi:phytoene desaturase family protein [Filimonas effusa]|uniref:NAD(P)/FAD-dependent oxidoreductase n=1 Tax=Filimonas effusa TaxID=2508721 RepID=A0A4Q1DE99_9BACT|nr:NAD(P)/FAD-dependent oxidoreductase [Filimonas effusa]RXK87308.1 NAD(P)/FAD-dependent oxidoreductase [Filimonas effusa]
MQNKEYDAVVVGAGPNGLAAAITLQQQGLRVLIIEGKDTPGGGLRTAELTLPGFLHDICSAVHPLAPASPFFSQLPLQQYGLEYLQPAIAAAHPFDDGKVAVLQSSVQATAGMLGHDDDAYQRLLCPLVNNWQQLLPELLAPLHLPRHPMMLARFGVKGLTSASWLARKFRTKEARGLWAGMAAHSIQPLSNLATSAIAMVLLGAAHTGGWPFPRGGAIKIAEALTAHFIAMGGHIETGRYITSLKQLPSSHAVMLDVTPQQLLPIAGHRFSSLYRWQLKRYRYGAGVFKIDWALDAPIPFVSPECRQAGTLHLGNTLEEIAYAEKIIWQGRHAQKPFVLLSQPTVFDPTRAPEGKHTAWAYCHVPHGSTRDMTNAIEAQVERFAPGFRERILARHTFNTAQMEDYNPNYIGGDINGGVINLSQLFTRPALRSSPYRTSAKGIYICSSATPPGGGVHGMCGYHAAQKALKDIWNK